MKKISNFIPDKVVKRKDTIDKLNSILKNNVNDNISSKIHVINYSHTTITIECEEKFHQQYVIKFESSKYVENIQRLGNV